MSQLKQLKRASMAILPSNISNIFNNNQNDNLNNNNYSIENNNNQNKSNYNNFSSSPVISHKTLPSRISDPSMIISSSNTISNLLSLSNKNESKKGNVEDKKYKFICKLSPIHTGSVQCSANVGSQIWIGCSDGSIRIWEMETFKKLEDRLGHNGPIYNLIFIKDHVWSCSQDRHIFIWSLKV